MPPTAGPADQDDWLRARTDGLALLPHPAWIFDLDRIAMLWGNGPAVDLWDAGSLESLTGRDFRADMSGPTRQRLRSYGERFERGEVVIEHWTFYPAGGALRAKCLSSGLPAPDGRKLMLVQAFPVERVKEISVQRSVEAVHHTSTLISLYTADGAVLMQNPAAELCFGSDGHDFGSRFADPQDARAAEAALTRGYGFAREVKVKTRVGERWHALEARPNRDPETGDRAILVDERDVTGAHRVAAALAVSERRLQNAIDSFPAAFALWDPQDCLTICNIRYRNNYSRFLPRIVPGVAFNAILSAIEEAAGPEIGDMPTDLWCAQRRSIRAAGGTIELPVDGGRWMLIQDRVMEDGSTVSVQTDITELKEREFTLVEARQQIERQAADLAELAEQLEVERQAAETARWTAEAANRAKSTFLATMSHEIRTPINGVIGMTGLLLESPLSADQHRMAEMLRDSGEMLLSIINDILDFSKIEAGKLTLDVAPFDLVPVLESVLDVMAERARAKKLDLSLCVAPDTPGRLTGDAGRLRQILVNLVGNAVKFTEAGGVTLSVEPAATTDGTVAVRFAVTDTGIGIPADRQSRLFEEFSQVDDSPARKFGGTGLGLAICKRLCSLMGGRIAVDSTPGRGSTFFFDLRFAEAGVDVMTSVDVQGLAEARARVLVADPGQTVRAALERQLRHWGLDVDVAADRDGIIRRLDEEAYGAMLVAAPLLDGGNVLRRLGELADPPKLVTLTASPFEGGADAVAGPDRPAVAVLAKPVRLSPLFDALATALGTPAHRAAGLDRDRRSRDPQPGPEPGEPLRILVAEDNPVNQDVARRLLESWGHRVDLAGNGLEAVLAVKFFPYDLVLMDVQMPEMDGLTATAEIRRLPGAQGRTPIVAMTANVTSGFDAECRIAGMDDYVAKPVNRNALWATLCKWQRRAGEETPQAAPCDVTAAPFDPEPPDAVPDTVDLDEEQIAELLEMFGPDGYRGMLDRLRDDGLGRLARMAACAAAGDAAGLSAEAHTLKSGAGSLGLCDVQALAAALESDANAAFPEDAETRVAQLQARFEGSLAALEDFCRRAA
ncbi:MAG: response regulator [Alphaproteobacteria bacterium]|nr:response regulator [Alphaproteobacteria bacterium]